MVTLRLLSVLKSMVPPTKEYCLLNLLANIEPTPHKITYQCYLVIFTTTTYHQSLIIIIVIENTLQKIYNNNIQFDIVC